MLSADFYHEQLAAVGMVNPQAPFGADLMSRIAYAQFEPKKLQDVRTCETDTDSREAVQALYGILDELPADERIAERGGGRVDAAGREAGQEAHDGDDERQRTAGDGARRNHG